MKDGTTSTGNWADYPGARRRQPGALSDRQHVRLRRRLPVPKIRIVPKAGPYSGGPAPFFDFVRDAEPGQQHGVHRSALPHLRGAAGRVPGELRFPSGSALTLWRIANPTAAPTLTRTSVRHVGLYAAAQRRSARRAAAVEHRRRARARGDLPRRLGLVRLDHQPNWGLGNRASVHWFQIRPPLPRWYRKASTEHGPLTISSPPAAPTRMATSCSCSAVPAGRVRFDRLHRPARDRSAREACRRAPC